MSTANIGQTEHNVESILMTTTNICDVIIDGDIIN